MKLYHYTTVEKAIQYILPSSELRMGVMENLNDPLENLLHYIEINSLVKNDGKSDIFDFIIATYIRNESKILSFLLIKLLRIKLLMVTLSLECGLNTVGKVQVFVWKLIMNLLLMKIVFFFNKNDIYRNKVIYNATARKRMPKQKFGVLAGIKHKSLSSQEFWNSEKIKEEFISDFFFTKNIDWQDESEYRFLKYSNEPVTLSIKKSLSNVYLGVYFSKFYLPSIKELVLNDIIKPLFIDLDGDYRDY